MKKYIDHENPRYVYYVRACLNGYAVQVLNVERDENYPLSVAVAGQLQVALPDCYRLQNCTSVAAEEELDRLANLNGWTPVD